MSVSLPLNQILKQNIMGYIIKRLWVILLLSVFISDEVNAQTQTITMNLRECIDYAYRNNISLKKSRVQVDIDEIDVKSAKAAFLPSLSASVSQNYSNHPFGADIVWASSNSYNGNYGVNSSMTLYNGGQNKNNLKLSELSVKMSGLDVAINESSIEMTIAQFYIQILYATDALEVNKQMLEVSLKTRSVGKFFIM